MKAIVLLPLSVLAVLAAFALQEPAEPFVLAGDGATAALSRATAAELSRVDAEPVVDILRICDRPTDGCGSCPASGCPTGDDRRAKDWDARLQLGTDAGCGRAVARRGLTIVTHAHRQLHKLDRPTLAAIFAGRVTDWSDLGGPAAPITVVWPHGDHQARELMARYLGIGTGSLVAGRTVASEDRVVGLVLSDPFAIGVAGLGPALHAVDDGAPLALPAIDGMHPTLEALRTGSWPLEQSLYLQVAADDPVSDQLLTLLHSHAGEQMLRKHGYEPL